MGEQRVVLALSFAFFLVFVAYNAAQSLSGSLKGPAGLAPFQFAALYLTFALTCIPAPAAVAYLGPKLSICLGALPYLGLVFSFTAPELCDDNGSNSDSCWEATPIWVLKLTFGVLVGIGAALLWTGQGVYLARLAAHAAAKERVLGRSGDSSLLLNESDGGGAGGAVGRKNKLFNGTFFAIFQCSGAFGLLASSLVLTLVPGNLSTTVYYLFVGLGACCAVGTVMMFVALPSVGPAPPITPQGNEGEGGKLADSRVSRPHDEEVPTVTLWETLSLCADPRMSAVVPVIVYNGLSMGFLFYAVNTLGFQPALGLSFVGFGSSVFYTVNAIATAAFGRLAARTGQMTVMAAATALQVVAYVLYLALPFRSAMCDASGCDAGTSGPCWRFPNNPDADDFPLGCNTTAGSPTVECAECAPYDSLHGQGCGSDWTQCQWLQGDAVAPEASTVALLLVAVSLLSAGDAVWESQIPAVLQTIFEPCNQAAALANLKLWQSLGIAASFGIATLDRLDVSAALCLVTLLLGSGGMAYAHKRVVNLDSGRGRAVTDITYTQGV